MKNIVEFVMNNWYVIFLAVVVLALLLLAAVKFYRMNAAERKIKIREWLLWAVTEAERQLGAGTGKLKLRMVYDMFVVRFPWLAKWISFTDFSDLVDDALVEMREMLARSEDAQIFVEEGKR